MKLKLTLTAILAAAVIGLFWAYTRTDTWKIKRVFKELAQQVDKVPGEGFTATIVKSIAMSNLLCPEININVRDFPYCGTLSSETALSVVLNARKYADVLSVSILDVEIQITSPDSALCRCSAKVHVESQYQGYGNFTEVRSFKAALKKIDGSWKLGSFEEDTLLVK